VEIEEYLNEHFLWFNKFDTFHLNYEDKTKMFLDRLYTFVLNSELNEKNKQTHNIDLYAAITVSLLNIKELDTTLNWLREKDIKYNLMTLYHPSYLAVSALPLDKKNVLSNYLSEEVKKYVAEQLNTPHSSFNETHEFLTQLDLIRNTNYKQIFSFIRDII
jgi:alpha-galactosidase/6-phospho-beta-glucosidase family protein